MRRVRPRHAAAAVQCRECELKLGVLLICMSLGKIIIIIEGLSLGAYILLYIVVTIKQQEQQQQKIMAIQ